MKAKLSPPLAAIGCVAGYVLLSCAAGASDAAALLVTAAQAVLALALAHMAGLGRQALGLCRPHDDRAVAIAAILWAALAAAACAVLPVASAPPADALDIVRVCFAAPVAEELVFRGLVLAGLRTRLDDRAAIAAQALLFAALHGTPAAMLYALGMGLVFSLAAVRTGSIWPGITLHIVNNGLLWAIGRLA